MLRKESTYEKINHHFPRAYYDALHCTEADRRTTALERRKKEFDKLPKKQRDILTAIGWSPYQQDAVVCRSTEYFAKHGTYVVDVGKKTE